MLLQLIINSPKDTYKLSFGEFFESSRLKKQVWQKNIGVSPRLLASSSVSVGQVTPHAVVGRSANKDFSGSSSIP
jgi:hypothetical protein